MWRPTPGHETLHSKVASFGQCGPVIVGSANLDGLSAEHNSESVVAIYDDDLRAELSFALLTDMGETRAEPVGIEVLEGAPLRLWWQSTLYTFGWYWM